jgi:hypothetical protein
MEEPLPIEVLSDAVESYRQLNESDPLRHHRKNSQVKFMISEGIKTHKFWPILRDLVSESEDPVNVRTCLEIKVFSGNYLERCRAVVISNMCAREYIVQEILPSRYS